MYKLNSRSNLKTRQKLKKPTWTETILQEKQKLGLHLRCLQNYTKIAAALLKPAPLEGSILALLALGVVKDD